MNHDLKTLPQYFEDVKSGIKNFELRNNDRGFAIGDTVTLLKYAPEYGYIGNNGTHSKDRSMTPREADERKALAARITKRIKHIFPGGQYGLTDGYVILGLEDA